jgi:hypothetical protein
MLRGFVTSALLGFARRKAGVHTIGTIPAALLTTGASLVLTRGRRPVGLAVAALGGFLLWREIEKQESEAGLGPQPALPLPPASDDASAAIAPR